MKGFIEVTEFDSKMKVLCPVLKITGIVDCDDGSVFIEMGVDGNEISSGILVKDSFNEIKEKLKQSEV